MNTLSAGKQISKTLQSPGARECDVCRHLGAEFLPKSTTSSFGSRIAPDIANAMRTLSNRGLALCDRCGSEIRQGREESLRSDTSSEITETTMDVTMRAPLLVQAELAITLASWAIGPWDHPAYTHGFAMLNAVFKRFPRAARSGAIPSALERNLSRGVIGVFSIHSGVFIIENLVSRRRGNGNASHAMKALCKLADTVPAPMSGVIEPNSYDGLPEGLVIDQLLAWYRKIGFVQLDTDPRVIVRLPQTQLEDRTSG